MFRGGKILDEKLRRFSWKNGMKDWWGRMTDSDFGKIGGECCWRMRFWEYFSPLWEVRFAVQFFCLFFIENTLVSYRWHSKGIILSFYSLFVIFLFCFGLCKVPCDINLQDGVPIVEPPPLGIHHMFGNKEAGVQVLEYVFGPLVEGYGDEVGAMGHNKLHILKACIICWLYTSVLKS